MERSMEGSSMFLDDHKNSQTGIDSLYDLFKRDTVAEVTHSSVLGSRDLELVKHFLNADPSSEDNNLCLANGSNSDKKRNLYPPFSEADFQ